MTAPVLNYRGAETRPEWPPFSLLEKLVHAFFGAVLPLVCFCISANNYPAEPDWQNGEWNRYLLFVPSGRIGYPFYPLLAYSVVSLILILVRTDLSRFFSLRLGLYAGIVLSLQYSYIQAAALASTAIGWEPPFLPSLALGLLTGLILLGTNLIIFGALKLLVFIWRRSGRTGRWALIGGVALLLLVAIGIGPRVLWSYVPELGWVLVLGAPLWCTGTYVLASWTALRLNRRQNGNVPRRFAWAFGVFAWAITYAAAWKWTINNAIAAYAALPITPPHRCYIATAAAAGHPGLVGSRRAVAADGSVFFVNRQLRRLKCVEIALATLCPKFHRSLRFAYDRLGPWAASVIRKHPLLADAAYLGLKPVELIVFGGVALICPQASALSDVVY